MIWQSLPNNAIPHLWKALLDGVCKQAVCELRSEPSRRKHHCELPGLQWFVWLELTFGITNGNPENNSWFVGIVF